MIISAFNTVKSINNINKKLPIGKTASLFACSGDVFTRTTSFSGKNNIDDKSYSSFKKWAEETDFLNNIDCSKFKMLGTGFEGNVYEIPDTDNWVLKEPKRGGLVLKEFEEPTILEVEDFSPKLNVGQVIARIEVPCGKKYSNVYYVLKKQSGTSLGVDINLLDNVSKYTVNTHIKSLEKLANAPQETFDKCIQDIGYVASTGYEFDAYNPHNYMFDETTQQINFVDINDPNKNGSNQYGEVLSGLLDGNFAIVFSETQNQPQFKFSKEAEKARLLSNGIITKFLLAMQKCNVKFSGGKYFNQLLDTDILNDVLNAKTKNERISELKNRNLL